jgi:hypothetical protein
MTRIVPRAYGLRQPSYEQLRSMAYQPLVLGVKGLTFWACHANQFRLAKSPQGQANLKRLLAELNSLTPILLSDPLETRMVRVEAPEGLLTREFRHGPDRYLMVVHQGWEALSIAASAENGISWKAVDVLFEEREIPSSGQSFVDDIPLPPLGARVYRMKKVAE